MKTIKKLDLKRETVKALKVRASIRTGDLLGATLWGPIQNPSIAQTGACPTHLGCAYNQVGAGERSGLSSGILGGPGPHGSPIGSLPAPSPSGNLGGN